MKRPLVKAILIRLTSLLLTCLIGIAGTQVTNSVYVRFESVSYGSVRMPPNGRGGVTSFRSSDGVNLIFYRLEFPSAAAARVAFEDIVGASSELKTREVIRDREGKFEAGERVIGLFPTDDGRKWPMMVCQDGRTLYQISSTSLRHIVIFEKAHRLY